MQPGSTEPPAITTRRNSARAPAVEAWEEQRLAVALLPMEEFPCVATEAEQSPGVLDPVNVVTALAADGAEVEHHLPRGRLGRLLRDRRLAALRLVGHLSFRELRGSHWSRPSFLCGVRAALSSPCIISKLCRYVKHDS